MTRASYFMVIHHANRLSPGIDDRGADEFEAALLEVFRHRRRPVGESGRLPEVPPLVDDRRAAGVEREVPVIAAGGVRAVLEVAGVRDILTKSMGSANVLNVVMATFDALDNLRSPAMEAARRGKRAEELVPFWERRKQHA